MKSDQEWEAILECSGNPTDEGVGVGEIASIDRGTLKCKEFG